MRVETSATGYVITEDDGTEIHVPNTVQNTHLRRIEAWKKAGGEVDHQPLQPKMHKMEKLVENDPFLSALLAFLADELKMTSEEVLQKIIAKA